MASQQYEDQKRELIFSKKQIDKAARCIRHGVEGEERLSAIEKIQNFREFHLYPLMLMKNHLTRTAKKVSPKVLVARRLKRLPTIINKLERPSLDGKSANGIKLTRMQDIAGCRAIVKNKDELIKLKDKLEKSRSVHQIIRVSNYLDAPKKSGYGGLHMIYSCYEGQEESHPWKGANVEVQLRTKLQHAWATSLEIIDTLEDIELKTSVTGIPEWRSFFSITGQLVAHQEKLCILSRAEHFKMLREFHNLEGDLNVSKKLQSYNLALSVSSMKSIPKSKRSGKGLFLIRMIKEQKDSGQNFNVQVNFFSHDNASEAIEELNKSELSDRYTMSVLVSAEGVRSLLQAYPNYFGSTKVFSDFLLKQRKILASYFEEENEALRLRVEELKKEAIARGVPIDDVLAATAHGNKK